MESKYDGIRAAVAALLERNGVTFSAVLLGERTRDGWKHDAWAVTLSRVGHSEDFDYCTGTGLRSKVLKSNHARPVAPHAADVLQSLILDSSAVGQSFDSWCNEFGYDSDSRKAEATYRACQESADKLARVLDHKARKELAELLQDY